VGRGVIVAAVLSLVLVGAGCSSDGGTKASTGARSSTSSSAPAGGSSTSSGATSSTTVSPACRPRGTTSPQSDELTPVNQLLSAVTTSAARCADSIVFTFEPNAAPRPSYVIEYADGPFTDSAGRAVRPPGSSYLKVRFQPAWIADLSRPSAPLTYTGPRVITPSGTRVVRGLAMYDAAEGVVGWIVGVDGTRAFTVDASPSRVVVTVSRA
jgi:hypothetical protein